MLILKVFAVGFILLADGKQLAPVRPDLSLPFLEVLQSIIVFLIDLAADLEIRPFGHFLPLEA